MSQDNHAFKLDELVQCDRTTDHGGGARETISARLWVHSLHRDPDGSPTYCLSRSRGGRFGVKYATSSEVSRIKED